MNPDLNTYVDAVDGYVVPMDPMADGGDFCDFDSLNCSSCQ